MTENDGEAITTSHIAVTRWSTDRIAPEHRFAAWIRRPWPSMATLFETTLLEDFETTSSHAFFGDMVVQLAQGSHRRYRRSLTLAAADRVEILAASIMVTCRATGRAENRAIEARRGSVVLLDMARQCDLEVQRGVSIQIAIPRDMAEEFFGVLKDLHGAVIPPGNAKLLIRYLQAVRKTLPVVTLMDGPALARVILELIGVGLGINNDANALVIEDTPSVGLAIKQYLETALQTGAIPEKDVCSKFRLSRSSLHRLFQRDGGLQSYVRMRRLENVRRVLLLYGKQDTVADLADSWGFSDASHLSRLFKRTYGVTITAYRAEKT